MFNHIPPRSIFCRYAMLKSGAWAVVTPSGKVLASSFFDLREKFIFVCSIFGAGGWVVLSPRASQPSLF